MFKQVCIIYLFLDSYELHTFLTLYVNAWGRITRHFLMHKTQAMLLSLLSLCFTLTTTIFANTCTNGKVRVVSYPLVVSIPTNVCLSCTDIIILLWSS